MKIYNQNTGKIIKLPTKIVGFGVNETTFIANRAKYANKGYYEFVSDEIDLIEQYKLTPLISVDDETKTANYSLSEAEQNIIDLNWHTPEYFNAKVGEINHNVCLYYWFRIQFDETTCISDDATLSAMFERAVVRRLAPYLAFKNGEPHYYLYLSYIQVSDGFTVDEDGTVIAPTALQSVPIQQLAPAQIVDGKIILA